ncbi:MAG: hypothetical protein IJ144_02195 [Prevotella sp.]|nr:hypothetical protein [Prevotella sp.]
MKKLSFLATFAVALMLCACNGKSGSSDALADITSDSTLVNEALAQEEVQEMEGVINALSACLDSIQVQENLLFKADENASKQQVLERLRAFKDLLGRKQAEINNLTANNKSNKATIANLNKMVDFLKQELETKTKQIAKLEEAVEKKDARISELRYDLNVVTQEREYLADQNYEQDKQLNQVFYIIADKKELKELGLVERAGFLGKKTANMSNIDQSKFIKKDKRYVTTLKIDSKKPKLLTPKPESSYTLEKNEDGTSTLTITDQQAFWAASPYLIIQK